MFRKQGQAAQKALSFSKDTIFRLLVVMTVLLGWVAGVGAGGLIGLENAYSKWQLNQSSRISVYLLPESDATEIKVLQKELEQQAGVDEVNMLSQKDVLNLLQPYFEENSYFPVPVVLEATVTDELSYKLFSERVKKRFPTAEIADARDLLTIIAKGVRTMQGVTLAVSCVILLIMGLLVSLMVRAGLRGQRKSMSILQYIGATDSVLSNLVTRQIMTQSMIGWLGAVVLTAITVFISAMFWENLRGFLTLEVWLGVVLVPLLLVFVAFVATRITTYHVIRRNQ